MPDITIDPGAVESARVSMLMVRDTLNGLHAQHTSEISEIENQLSDISASVMEQFDPFGIWERFGFDRASYHCQFIRGSIEQVRGDIERIMVHLCESHRGPLAGVIRDRAGDLLVAINSAVDSLWTITSLFDLGNIKQIVRNPGLILEHFSNSRRALSHACAQAEEFVDFLTQLHTNELKIIADISSTFAVSAPSLNSGSVTIQGSSNLFQGSSLFLPDDQTISKGSAFSGEEAAENARLLEKYLIKGANGQYSGFNTEAFVNSFPPDKRDEMRQFVENLFGQDKRNWFNTDGSFSVQCVAFVALTYALTTGRTDFLPPKGNAGDLWDAYANHPEKGWREIDNKAGSTGWPPQVGDMVPMSYGTWGHVAVVTAVYMENGQVVGIDIAQGNSHRLIETLKVINGVVDSPPGPHIQGFIRYTGA